MGIAAYHSGLPSDLLEPPDAALADVDPLGAEQRAFQLQVSTVAAERSRGAHDAMTGGGRIAAAAHDVAHGAGRARTACERRDIAVGGDAAWGNPPGRCQYALAELRRHRPMTSFTRKVAPPRSDSLNSLDTLFGSPPRASGTVAHCASAAAPIHRARRNSAPPRIW